MQGSGDGSWSANGGFLPQSTHQFPSFNLQQQPNGYNFHNLYFPPHQFCGSATGASQFHESSSNSRRDAQVMRISKAVNETRQSLVDSGQNVSSIKVSQLVLAKLPADSFVVQMHDVPSFSKLMSLEAKINAFIHCFIGARGIVTLHDLEVAICRNESVDSFDDLELGPLLQHPLVLLYFPSFFGYTGPVQISSEEIISFLDSYLNNNDMDDVQLDEFLDFVAKRKSVSSKEKLGVRIQNLRMYVSFIQDAKRQEGETLKILLTELHQKYHILSSNKQRQDKSLTDSEHANESDSEHADSSDSEHADSSDSEHADSSALHLKDFCGKHTRFHSSSSDDSDSADYEVEYVNSSNHFSRYSCPYPSVAQEMKRLRGCNKKRKAESRNDKQSNSSKLLRRRPSKLPREYAKQEIPKSAGDSDAKQVFSVSEADITLSEGALKLFISTWKEKCKELSMSTLVENILSSYNLRGTEVQVQMKRDKVMSSFPFVGLLNVAKELVTEALEGQIQTETIDIAGYDNNAGPSSGANKLSPLQPLSMKRASTSGNPVHEWNNSVSADCSIRDLPHTSNPWNAQAQQTGRKGEEIAYIYFASKYGKEAVVRWVNEHSETGLPYDLVIENRSGKIEYVEVKATGSTQKDHFNLSVNEWQFANEKGESYVIAHVLLGNSNAIISQHRNLVKLCQRGHFRLHILMPNKRNEVNVPF